MTIPAMKAQTDCEELLKDYTKGVNQITNKSKC